MLSSQRSETRFCRILLVCVLLFCSLVLMGCGGQTIIGLDRYTVGSDHWVAEWYRLQYCPLYFDGVVAEANDRTRLPRTAPFDPSSERFVSSQRYGKYVVLDTSSRSLLVDRDRPMWAGSCVVPVRSGGKVYALYLLSGRPSMEPDDGLFEVITLSLDSNVIPDIGRMQVAYVKPMVPRDWVFDIGDNGTEELVTLEAWCESGGGSSPGDGDVQPSTIAAMTRIRWVLRVYGPGLRDVGPNPPRCLLTVPLPREDCPATLALENVGKGVLKLSSTRLDRPGMIGVIRRDPSSSGVVFSASH
jgi:hypothetical protein